MITTIDADDDGVELAPVPGTATLDIFTTFNGRVEVEDTYISVSIMGVSDSVGSPLSFNLLFGFVTRDFDALS
ncbi:hypothetical protein, partial [Heyndrickxia coagulans]|uniref:hypothetical protein n=1 Tax=Heyndrickxia coagulans TaxID=1398 RepID=UPI00214D82AB